MNYNRYSVLAGCNQWANERIYTSATNLSDADYRADRGAFFKSVHGTLNHILVADYLWMRRFTGAGPTPSRLDEILHDNLPDLTRAREAEDKRIIDWVATLDDKKLRAEIHYTAMTNPTPVSHPLAPAIDHLFNHQTHHRGQVHALLTAMTGDAPSIDLMVYYRQYCL